MRVHHLYWELIFNVHGQTYAEKIKQIRGRGFDIIRAHQVYISFDVLYVGLHHDSFVRDR